MLLLIAFYCDIVGIPVHWICNDLMESLLYIAQRLTNNNIRLCTGLLRKSRSVCFAGCKAKQFVGNQVILSCLFRIRECVRGTCPRYSALLLTLHVKLSRLGELTSVSYFTCLKLSFYKSYFVEGKCTKLLYPMVKRYTILIVSSALVLVSIRFRLVERNGA